MKLRRVSGSFTSPARRAATTQAPGPGQPAFLARYFFICIRSIQGLKPASRSVRNLRVLSSVSLPCASNLLGRADEHLGARQHVRPELAEDAPQVVLNARAAERPVRHREDGHRLVLPGLVRRARSPVDRVLERRR